MKILRSWIVRLFGSFKRNRRDREFAEEMESHLAMHIEDNLRLGMSPEESRRNAWIRLGGVDKVTEEYRDRRGIPFIENFIRDIRYSFRRLVKDLGFTIGVILLLALGIGSTVAVFSIINGVLLRPLPYRNPDRLFVIREMIPENDETPRSVNALHFSEWQRESKSFAVIALSQYIMQAILTGYGDPERIPALRVTPNYFSLLGVSAQIGRTFTDGDRNSGQDMTVVISEGLWRRRFGGDPDIIGKEIHLDGIRSVIIGILPRGFKYHLGSTEVGIDIYAPWNIVPQDWWRWTNNYSYSALGRLRNNVSVQSAEDELNGIQAAIARDRFEAGSDSLHLRAVLVPFNDWVTGNSRRGLLLLLAAVGIALFIACLNIANLMLVRTAGRNREFGIRTALGASRMRIFSGALIESALLAFVGTSVGIGLAAGALKFFSSIAPADLPRIGEVQIDWTVMLIALCLTMMTTLAFGLFPAMRATRIDPLKELHGNSRSSTESAGELRSRRIMISIEVALSTILLIVGGLLVLSYLRIDAVERGYNSANVLTAQISLPNIRYPDDGSKLRFFESLVEELQSKSGITAVGITSALPLTGNVWGSTAIPVGMNPPEDQRSKIQYRFISSGYFNAMGIPIITGRSFGPEEFSRHIAILSVQAARLLWPDSDFIGKYFWRGNPEEIPYEVVGLVPDVHSEDLTVSPKPIIYTPLQATGSVVMPYGSIVIRTQGNPSTATGILRDAIRSLDQELPLSSIQTMQQIESSSLGDRRFQMIFISAFAAASLLIAVVGIYSLLRYTTIRRTQEIAIRMALGARRTSVITMVLGQGIKPVLLGLGLGLAATLVLGRFLSSMLFSVSPTNGITYGIVIAIIVVSAFLACLLPAWRASRTLLSLALRYE